MLGYFDGFAQYPHDFLADRIEHVMGMTGIRLASRSTLAEGCSTLAVGGPLTKAFIELTSQYRINVDQTGLVTTPNVSASSAIGVSGGFLLSSLIQQKNAPALVLFVLFPKIFQILEIQAGNT